MSKNKRKLKRPSYSPKIKRVGKTKRDKRNKLLTTVFVVSFLCFILSFLFIDDETLGHDIRYNIFVFWGPLVIGFIALVIYQWEFIRYVYKSAIHLRDMMISTVYLLFGGIIFSYIIFGNLANLCFILLNNKEANDHMPQVIHCQVSSFNKGKRKVNSTIGFKFKNDYELFAVSEKYIEPYLQENPNNYEIQIIARKGIWNYYVVDEWNLKHIE